MQPPKERGPFSIVLRQKEAWGHVSRALTQNKIRYTNARNEADGIRIQSQNAKDYRQTVRMLNTFRYQYHTYKLEEDRRQHVEVFQKAQT